MTLKNIANTFDAVISHIATNAHIIVMILAVLWGIHLLNWLSGYRLNKLGIYPRRIYGLPGIIFSPFLHGNAGHLLMNSIPLAILAALISVKGTYHLFWVTVSIVLITNGLIWIFGRKAIHIGASGVVMGYWSYLLISAYQEKSLLAIILAAICLYYFAGLFINLFPRSPKVSWEGHVFGFCAGIVASLIMV